ncbi:MAG: PQQ-binding-like beta-propeller repeat protein [Planctomycetaceae bacterium]|nr:PQQ-binding-like beta-propeller repeat protein [Planctomycetaceae bacterium]
MSIPRLIAAGLVTATMVVSAWNGPLASGQGFLRSTQGNQAARFIEAPRGIQQQIREAERALDDDRDSDAVVRLGDLLSGELGDEIDSDLIGQDFFLEVDDSRPTGKPVRGSLLRKARDMIGALPVAALETYELRYGPLARKSLTEAAKERNWQQVRDVRRKYFHTLAGFEASLLLAQREMYRGHALAASLLLDDVVRNARGVNHLGRSVLLMHAAACYAADREIPEPENLGNSEVTVDGQSVTLSKEEMSAWLKEHFSLKVSEAVGQVRRYPFVGAKPNRNGSNSGQMPLSNLRWMLDTTASPRQQRAVRGSLEELTTSGKLPPPSWVPLRVGDQLLMRTTERLVGVDYRTGKRVWTYPWQSSNEMFDDDESSLDINPGDSDSSNLLTQRVWNDIPYGQITADDERVYLLDDLREVEMAYFGGLNIRGTRPANTGKNSLIALELETEGKLRWSLGSGSDEVSSLSDAFFLGPPLPLDGRLYVMAEIAGDINLCCLEPRSGEEIWRQQLVAVESGGIDADPIRRVAGAMPTYYEGLLICPTGAGATVAIDLADRTLRWGVNYDRSAEMSRSMTNRGRNLDPNQLMQRWSLGIAIADQQNVLLTPIESDRLYGFNLLTGESLFSRKARGYMRYLAGIRDNHFFVVGSNQVRGYDMKGEMIWTTDRDMLPAGQLISGRGMFAADEYLLPTTTNQVIRISLKDGSVIDRRRTTFPLGNLVAVDGEIISQAATSLSVAFGETTLEPLVNRMLEENPNNFDALVRKAELLIQKSERDEALALLKRARELQADNDEVRLLSVTAMLGKLRDSDQNDPDLIRNLDELIDRPAQRVELLSLRIRAALGSGELVNATKLLLDLSGLVIDDALLESAADRVINDSTRQCSIDAWIAARAADIGQQANTEQLAEIRKLLIDDPRVNGSTTTLRRLYRHFGSLDGSQPLREELASRLREDEDYLGLERLALGMQNPSPAGLKQLSDSSLYLLADAYVRGKIPRDALSVLQELESRSDATPDEKIAALKSEAMSQLVSVQWAAQASLRWESRNPRVRSFIVSQRVADTDLLAGTQFSGWRLISEGSSNPMSLRDPTGLLRRIPMEGIVDDMDKKAQISGGMMVVVMPKGLIGLNLHHIVRGDGEVRMWRRGLSGDSEPVAKRRSSITPFDDQVVRYSIANAAASSVIPEFKLGPIMGDRVLLLQGGDLLAIDALTADTIWRNSTAPKSGSVLCDGKRVAVVSDATNEVQFFDLLDGRKLGTKPWQHGTVWAGLGEHVLSYQEQDEKRLFTLKLVDPFSEEIVLTHDGYSANRSNVEAKLPSGYGRVIGGRYMVHLGNDGQAVIWDIVDGKEIGTPKLPAYEDLQELRLMLMDDLLLVLPKRRAVVTEKTDERLQTSDGSFHKPTHGVFAISLQDGSVRWSREFERPWGCTLTQPAESPMLILARSPFTFSTASRRKSLDVLALDIRDGSDLALREGKPISSSNNSLETRQTVQPGLSRVIAQIGTELLTFSFGKDADQEQKNVGPGVEAEKAKP